MREAGVNDEGCARIGADRIEGTMTKGNLAAIADEDVQPEERDRVDENVREPEELEIGAEKRGESSDRREGEQPADSPVR
jgi:hypothetical protein